MNSIKRMSWGGMTAVLGLSLALLLPSVSLANTRTVNSGQILIISDELGGNSVDVERAGAGGAGGCDSSGTDSSNSSSSSSSDSGGGGGSNNTSTNCSNNSSTDT